MQFAATVPSVTIERRMDLTRLVAARKACTPVADLVGHFYQGIFNRGRRIRASCGPPI